MANQGKVENSSSPFLSHSRKILVGKAKYDGSDNASSEAGIEMSPSDALLDHHAPPEGGGGHE